MREAMFLVLVLSDALCRRRKDQTAVGEASPDVMGAVDCGAIGCVADSYLRRRSSETSSGPRPGHELRGSRPRTRQGALFAPNVARWSRTDANVRATCVVAELGMSAPAE